MVVSRYLGWIRLTGWLAVTSALATGFAATSCSAASASKAPSAGPDDAAAKGSDSGMGTPPMDGGVDSFVPSSDAGADSEADDVEAGPPTAPMLLSQTGLFKSVAADATLVLESGVNEYQPLNALWADGASKTRWIFLPPGTQIDTSDPDHWHFAAGTKFWKEFALNGHRLETRLLWIYGSEPDDFLVVTYWWNPEAGLPDDAEMADPFLGAQDVNGTMHDIPSQEDCHTCHDSLEEHVLGFGAIELNHALPGVNIHTLVDAGLLTTEPSLTSLAIPGDSTAQAALGYLHTNCGICHNSTPGAPCVPPMYLRLAVGTATVQDTDTYKTAVDQTTTALTTLPYRIAGGEPAESCVIEAMSNRGGRDQMPPLATKEVDTAGVAAITAWIDTLPMP